MIIHLGSQCEFDKYLQRRLKTREAGWHNISSLQIQDNTKT